MSRIQQSHRQIEITRPEIDENGMLQDQFIAWLPDEVFGVKIDNFISEFRAKALKLSREHVRLRVGQPSGFWRWQGITEVPVDVDIRFERSIRPNEAMTVVNVTLKVRRNRIKQPSVHADCLRIVRGLRMNLIAKTAGYVATA